MKNLFLFPLLLLSLTNINASQNITILTKDVENINCIGLGKFCSSTGCDECYKNCCNKECFKQKAEYSSYYCDCISFGGKCTDSFSCCAGVCDNVISECVCSSLKSYCLLDMDCCSKVCYRNKCVPCFPNGS